LTRKHIKRKKNYAPLKLALEPRILFDASLVAPHHHDATIAQDAAPQITTPANPHDVPHASDVARGSTPAAKHANGEAHLQDTAKNATTIRSGISENNVAVQGNNAATAVPVELVFIDSTVQNPQSLLAGISPNAKVYYLNSSTDGIEQMDKIQRLVGIGQRRFNDCRYGNDVCV
jgi:hypothetical protein